MLAQGQNIICTLLKKLWMTALCQFNIHMLMFILQYLNIFDLLKLKKVKTFKKNFFSKVQIMLWPWESIGVVSPKPGKEAIWSSSWKRKQKCPFVLQIIPCGQVRKRWDIYFIKISIACQESILSLESKT